MDPNGISADPGTVEAPASRGLVSKAPLLAGIGGCIFAAFWISGVFKISVPWAISLPFHAVAMVTLAIGVMALQKDQTRDRPQEGWTWIPAMGVAISVFISFEVFLVSTILFSLVTIRLDHLPRAGAILLILGAAAFMLAFFVHGPFWSENNPEPGTALALVFTGGLVLMAAGWVVLARGAADSE